MNNQREKETKPPLDNMLLEDSQINSRESQRPEYTRGRIHTG
jgi:hypothetical protein